MESLTCRVVSLLISSIQVIQPEPPALATDLRTIHLDLPLGTPLFSGATKSTDSDARTQFGIQNHEQPMDPFSNKKGLSPFNQPEVSFQVFTEQSGVRYQSDDLNRQVVGLLQVVRLWQFVKLLCDKRLLFCFVTVFLSEKRYVY